jgi:hypothetical protein
MKQDAVEKLTERFSAKQAQDVLEKHVNEFGWTAGLEDFLKENDGKKITKQQLLDVIQKGQVRVEASVASEEQINNLENQRQQVINEASVAANRLYEKYNTEEFRHIISRVRHLKISADEAIYKRRLNLTEEDANDFRELQRLAEKDLELDRASQNRSLAPKFSLKAYTYEKLELPGAENSKEVKLISPMVEAGRDRLEKLKYQAPHWDEPNVVAHYRANDRTTTDNIPIYFSEEFQSDWNHDIREQGARFKDLTKENYKERRYKFVYNPEKKYWELQQPSGYAVSYLHDADPNLSVSALEDMAFGAKNEQYYRDTVLKGGNVEPNPFMEHLWKELVLKRFIRDAVVAKDDKAPYKVEPTSIGTFRVIDKNGMSLVENRRDKVFTTQREAEQFASSKEYKYEGIGWTTARQQQERYGKILEGKDFHWSKNPNGTYTFVMDRDGDMFTPHELESISLERFAELTTKEAAQEVRDQEEQIRSKNEKLINSQNPNASKVFDPSQLTLSEYLQIHGKGFTEWQKAIENKEEWALKLNDDFGEIEANEGKFSLKEVVEIRSGVGKYSDYDVALVNIAKQIGKRFGAKYSEKEIELPDRYDDIVGKGEDSKPTKEKIHYLEITPSMRDSLTKEGFPLYGTGRSEPLKSQEVGVRNRITSQQGFDEHRNSLVEALSNEASLSTNEIGEVFNSGLSPDALIDSLKLTWSDAKDFVDFSKELIGRFGEQIKPYLQDLWIQVKGFSSQVKDQSLKLIDNLDDYLSQGKDSPAFKARQTERGAITLIGQKKAKATLDYIEDNKKIPYYGWYSLWRGVGLAQIDPAAGEVYDILRMGQRVKNSFESSVLFTLRDANNNVKNGGDQQVADNIWIGNEQGKTYTNAELLAGDTALGRPALSKEQIAAYRDVRKAIDINLDIQKEKIVYGLKQRALKLNDRLLVATTQAEQDAIKAQLLDIADAINKAGTHFDTMKKSGYISTQRRGKIAAYTEDPSFPVGDPKRTIYQHFDTLREANKWILENEASGTINSDIHDVRKPLELRKVVAKLTPSQFEDLIDSAGVNPHSPEVEQLRDEVYSRYPTMGYQLKRDFVRGYDRNWQFVLDSVVHQTETYASSFYSRVAGEEAGKKLNDLGLQDKNYNLYQTLQKYIDDEISSPEGGNAAKIFAKTRKGVYLFQLGFDVNQLYLNALAQPITQTYSYFARVEHNGIKLKGLEPEAYFARGGKLAAQLAKDSLVGSSNADPQFAAIYDRLKQERVIEPEFNRSLLESEAENTVGERLKPKSVFKTVEHWSGVFMRAGEKTTRTHVAAEAFLVGKEKFGLAGEELVNFIVRAVDATQSNPTRAEAPLVVRQPLGNPGLGEATKLLYQFNAFNHMWIENLALNVRSDFQNRSIKATARHLYPLVIMGGIRGLPLSAFSFALYSLITGEDPRKKFAKMLGNDTWLERTALYGVTQSAGLSNRLTPSAPILDNIRVGNTFGETLSESASAQNIPAVATAGQIAKGFSDLLEGQKLRGLGEILPFKPLRTAATAERYNFEGIKTRAGQTIIPKSKVTVPQKVGASIGISPNPLVEHYEDEKTKRVQALRNKLKRIF